MQSRILRRKVGQYARLARFDRPIGTLLLLWPTLWALWLSSDGRPDPFVVVVFVVGVVLMRAAGCVINDYADRHIDPHVSRTAGRPLASGEVSSREALVLFALLSLSAFGLVLFLNRLAVLLAFPAIALAASYPFMKRHTYLPQVHLGIAFGWGVPMAYAAQTGSVPTIAWLVLVAVVLWAVVYDTMYAMVDREDDIKINVKSTAILFGEADRAWIGILQLMFLGVLLIIGYQLRLGSWYHSAIAVAGLLSVYQQYLIRERIPARCFKAFQNNTWLGAAVFAGIVAEFIKTS